VKDVGINGRIMLKCILNLMIMRAYRPQLNSFCVCICLHVCVCVCVYIRVHMGVSSCDAGSMLVETNRPNLVQRLQRAHPGL